MQDVYIIGQIRQGCSEIPKNSNRQSKRAFGVVKGCSCLKRMKHFAFSCAENGTNTYLICGTSVMVDCLNEIND